MTSPEAHVRSTTRPRLIAVAAMVAMSGAANAFEFDLENPDWALRWDNTVKASTMYRLKAADPVLVNSFGPGVPQALNFNAGNDNFRNKGFVSKRLDLLTEFDAVYKKQFGFRMSGAGWYDASYNGTSDAQERPGPTAIPGVFSPGNGQTPYNEFGQGTKGLAGHKAELLDAFVFGGWRLGENMKLTGRLGRHALLYGESLFFGDNGIARAQGPTDVAKLQASPNAQFKEIIRPVPQVSAQLQLSDTMSIAGYYQFRWEADRLAPVGSYFSVGNTAWDSSGLPQYVGITAGPLAGNHVALPTGAGKPRDAGQFGLQFKWNVGETDLGFYAARYHDKAGQLRTLVNLANNAAGQYYYEFSEAIKTVGASATQSIGNTNFAAEMSLRWDQPLINGNVLQPLGTPLQRLAKGNTAHVNLSWLSSLSPNFLARESSVIGELAWNRVLSVNDPDSHLDHGRTRDATALQVIFTPTYRQALPGLDLGVPIGLRYVLDGRSAITGHGWGARGTGTATIGLDGNYDSVWQVSLAYNKFIGSATVFVDYQTYEYAKGNPLADRDFLSFSLRRTF